jgi:hypothetical protein
MRRFGLTLWFCIALWMLFLIFFDFFVLSIIVSKDFGAVIIGPLVASSVYVVAVVIQVAVGLTLLRRRSAIRVSLFTMSSALLLAPFMMIYFRAYLTGKIEAAESSAWLDTHTTEIGQVADQPSVLVRWDAWGAAGMENDSYLVSDPTDRLLVPENQAEWKTQVGVTCDLVNIRRLRRGIFEIVTYECPIDDAKVKLGR